MDIHIFTFFQDPISIPVSTEQGLSQTNESCLCKLSSPFTMGFYQSQYDYVIVTHVR